IASQITVTGNVSIGSQSDTLTIESDLELDYNTLTLTGAAAGTVVLNGEISDPVVGGVTPGLRAGEISVNFSFDPNPGNLGLQLQPHHGLTNVVSANPLEWRNESTFVYTGQFFDADGIFA